LENFWGTVTLVMAMAMIFVGFPSQLIKHYREKRCGLTMPLILIPLSLYFARINYCVLIKSWYILIPDVCGALLMSIGLVQYFLYRRNR